MELVDFIVIGIIALIIGGALTYIIKAKKSGKKCIGCPDSCSCRRSSSNGAAPSCGGACSMCQMKCSLSEKSENK